MIDMIYQNMLVRRSVRQFIKDKPISEAEIEYMLKCAMQAPSARNEQAWEFMVINDRALLDKIASSHPYGRVLVTAPLAIVVVGNTQKVKSQLFPQDLAAATQNILLAATALELGSCWMGIHLNDDRAKSLTEVLSLPEHIVPFSVIAIGHPEDPTALKPIDRYQPEVVHYNRW